MRGFSVGHNLIVDCFGPCLSRAAKGPLPCVVTSPWGEPLPPSSTLRALINPANQLLVGTSLPYFPRGDPLPVPPPPGLGSSSGWGGMDAGSNMVYPAQAVDGVTHLHAGPKLRTALAATRFNSLGQRCRIGSTVLSPAFQLTHFDLIAHTPTPFWCPSTDHIGHMQWRQQLISCYLSSVLAVVNGAPPGVECTGSQFLSIPSLSNHGRSHSLLYIATPLLGSGASGAPVKAAVEVAVEAVSYLRACNLRTRLMLRFVSNDAEAFAELNAALLI